MPKMKSDIYGSWRISATNGGDGVVACGAGIAGSSVLVSHFLLHRDVRLTKLPYYSRVPFELRQTPSTRVVWRV